jgi:8-oxo-dGTP pyrophosphatase MutT (NUDIX family)
MAATVLRPTVGMITAALSRLGRTTLVAASKRAAAVAIILREMPDSDTECLLLVRKHKKRDAWAGHVCLPGGRLEPGESALEAAIRETGEETGIPLVTDGPACNASVLGQLDDRSAQGLRPSWMHTRPPLHVSTFVFHLHRGDEPLELQASEIDGACWVPLAQLWDRAQLCEWPLKLGYGQEVACPAVRLKSSSPVVLSAEASPERLVPEPADGIAELGERWRLWGMTLGITEDLRHALTHESLSGHESAAWSPSPRLDWPPVQARSLLLYLPVWASLALSEIGLGGARGRWSWRSVALVTGVAVTGGVLVAGWV